MNARIAWWLPAMTGLVTGCSCDPPGPGGSDSTATGSDATSAGSGGSSAHQCRAGKEWCGDACVNLQANAKHCGACDAACATAQKCVEGECRCSKGTLCGDSCVNVKKDEENCGACGTQCGIGQRCAAGECVCSHR